MCRFHLSVKKPGNDTNLRRNFFNPRKNHISTPTEAKPPKSNASGASFIKTFLRFILDLLKIISVSQVQSNDVKSIQVKST